MNILLRGGGYTPKNTSSPSNRQRTNEASVPDDLPLPSVTPESKRKKVNSVDVRSIPPNALSTRDNSSSSVFKQKVLLGNQLVDFRHQIEPIAQESFQTLMDCEPKKPFFAFARVHSIDASGEYTHLYSAENIISWYPLQGKTDPCTRGDISKVEYYLYMKSQQEAIHVGDGYAQAENNVSKTTDYLIWSISAEDEPSKMMSLMVIAFLSYIGHPQLSTYERLNTSDILQLDTAHTRTLYQEEEDKKNGSQLYHYISAHLSSLIEKGEIKCSNVDVLLTSIKYDAAKMLAEDLVEQDVDIDEESDDYAKQPHLKINQLTMDILAKCSFT